MVGFSETSIGGKSKNPALPRVSIAMATYNGERYIHEQLESLALQTLRPIELVVTDDGSTDRTIEILEEFVGRAPFPVRIFVNEERLGHAENFLKACRLCIGDLIACCDQDDIWMKEKVDVSSRPFIDDKILLSIHAGRLLFKDGKFGGKWPNINSDFVIKKRSAYPLKSRTIYAGFAMVFRRQVIEILDNSLRPQNIFDPSEDPGMLGHDGWIWFLCSSFGEVALIQHVLCWYRQHDTYTIGAGNRKSVVGRLRQIVLMQHYDKIARIEQNAAHLCKIWITTASAPFNSDCQYWADYYVWLSSLHILRASIYGDQGNFYSRLTAITKITRLGGYFRYQDSPGLGVKALIKDIVLGLPRFDRLLSPSPHLKNR